MGISDQRQVWDNIAEEWNEFKKIPTEHVFDFLKNKKGNILDLGSGSGRNLIKIKDGKMYLVDFSKKMIELAKKKAKEEDIDAEFSVSNLTKLPFKANFFDYAIAMHSIYCLETKEKREKAIKELYRVLKPNSEVLISVWDKESKRFIKYKKEKKVSWKDKGERYYYLFDKDEIYSLFKKQGFTIISEIKSSVNITFVVQKQPNKF